MENTISFITELHYSNRVLEAEAEAEEVGRVSHYQIGGWDNQNSAAFKVRVLPLLKDGRRYVDLLVFSNARNACAIAHACAVTVHMVAVDMWIGSRLRKPMNRTQRNMYMCTKCVKSTRTELSPCLFNEQCSFKHTIIRSCTCSCTC